MPSVNEELQDLAIRHLMFLTRLQNQQANQILSYVNRTIVPDITSRLDTRMARILGRGFDPGPITTARVDSMLKQFKKINRANFREMERRVTASALAIARQEAQWQAGTISKVLNVNVDFDFPSTSQLRNAVLQRPFSGQKMNDWFSDISQRTTRNLNGAIRQGIIEGDTVGQMVRRVRGTRALGFTDGVMQATRRQAETLVRTSVIHASTQGRELLYDKNESLIKGVQWISTLDNRTCPICGSLDGTVFKINEGERPPIHPLCRCTTVPLLKTAKELGLNVPKLPPATRASANGLVPAKLTYNNWLRQQANRGRTGIVREALGKTRADLFIKGKLRVSDFVAGNKVLTLAQLRRREGSVFRKLNLGEFGDLRKRRVERLRKQFQEQKADKNLALRETNPQEYGRLTVTEKGRLTKTEHIVSVDTDSNRVISVATSGKRMSVSIPDSVVGQITDPKRNIDLIHNHPSSKSLSPADIYVIDFYRGASKIIAYGHDGSFYEAAIHASRSGGGGARITRILESYEREFRADFMRAFQAGKFGSVEIGEAFQSSIHAYNLSIHQMQFISYGYDLSTANFKNYLKHRKVLDKLMDNIFGTHIAEMQAVQQSSIISGPMRTTGISTPVKPPTKLAKAPAKGGGYKGHRKGSRRELAHIEFDEVLERDGLRAALASINKAEVSLARAKKWAADFQEGIT